MIHGSTPLLQVPSGTGKTFAAKVLASSLGWRLFRVDLGLLVSKWVGETEKNLNRLFEAADGQRLMLLFDEAHSLFGKRGSVRVAPDRYANMEIGYLLRHLEHHRGPVIVTTNLREQLDSAFLRLLAEAVVLTGMQIHNACSHAAMLTSPRTRRSASATSLARCGRALAGEDQLLDRYVSAFSGQPGPRVLQRPRVVSVHLPYDRGAVFALQSQRGGWRNRSCNVQPLVQVEGSDQAALGQYLRKLELAVRARCGLSLGRHSPLMRPVRPSSGRFGI